MFNKMFRFVLTVAFVLMIGTIEVSPALALGVSTPAHPPVPPTLPAVFPEVGNHTLSETSAIIAAPRRLSQQQLAQVLRRIPPQRKPGLAAATSSVYTYFTVTTDTNWNARSSFEYGEGIGYVGEVQNNTGNTQWVYLAFYLTNPCWSGYIGQGWIQAPAGLSAWGGQSNVPCSTAGFSRFFSMFYYNNGWTYTGWNYAVGILARAQSWVNAGVTYSQKLPYVNGYRRDCSGYVSMAWMLSTSGGGDSTDGFLKPKTPYSDAYKLPSFDYLQPGDALLTAPGYDGHIVLFQSWVNQASGVMWVYEENCYYPGHTSNCANINLTGGGAQKHQVTLNKSTGALTAPGYYYYGIPYMPIRRNPL